MKALYIILITLTILDIVIGISYYIDILAKEKKWDELHKNDNQ